MSSDGGWHVFADPWRLLQKVHRTAKACRRGDLQPRHALLEGGVVNMLLGCAGHFDYYAWRPQKHATQNVGVAICSQGMPCWKVAAPTCFWGVIDSSTLSRGAPKSMPHGSLAGASGSPRKISRCITFPVWLSTAPQIASWSCRSV